ncbi:hypothetical protein DPMN_136061 [Dreissena polymorpha]|uniref:Uncharacterized protein n=1 Tax=Dreissena polymorpha TaxID=45954 RepID=A0A9D4FYZ1_DREPO|nr:hypothetical protein DPMN_136061 [Dreissena polymorpha]
MNIYGNGKRKVEKALVIFARVEDEVLVYSKMTLTATPTTHRSYVPIYRTKHRKPLFTTDPGCELLCKLCVDHEKDVS